MQVTSVPDLEPFVLFLDGKAREKRLMVNAEEIIPKLKQTFPGTPPLTRAARNRHVAHPYSIATSFKDV